MDNIRWKLIPRHEHYVISEYGDVMDIRTDKLIRPTFNKGYARVRLDGERYYIHKLVAMAFFPDYNGSYVKHKDGDRLNNYVDNLTWDKETVSRTQTQVVCCGDCRYRDTCEFGQTHPDDWYCADGKW